MGLSIVNTFVQGGKLLLQKLDDNFQAVVTYIATNTTSDKWNDSVKCGGYLPSIAPGASQIPVLDANGNMTVYHVVTSPGSLHLCANAYLDGATWKFIGTGYATRISLDITSQAAPLYYQSTASGLAAGAITWSAASSIALGTGGASAQADSLKEIVSGLYRQASSNPAANQIMVLDGSAIGHFPDAIFFPNNKAIVMRNSLGVDKEIVKIATSDVAIIGNSILVTNIIGSSVQVNGVVLPFTKVISIGDWNMDTTSEVVISHGLTFAKIVDVRATIINDAGNALYSLERGSSDGTSVSGFISTSTTDVALDRVTGGIFDNASFDSTSFNRGFIAITYTY